MKLKLSQINGNTVALFLLSVAFLITSIAVFQQEHQPRIIVYNPVSNIARVVRASRDDAAIRDLMLGGLREAVAIATGSHPYGVSEGNYRVDENIMNQLFSPSVGDYIAAIRQKIAVDGHIAPELTFNVEQLDDVKVKPSNDGFYFMCHFTQTITADGKQHFRTFEVKAMGNLAPATLDNPYQIKFSNLHIRELEIKKQR